MHIPVNPLPAAGSSGGLASAPVTGRGEPEQAPTGGTAQALRAQAGHGLAEAQRQADPAERFLTAYLAALRGAAALLAVHGRAHRGRSRPTSAWVLLASAVPELAGWATFFAEQSETRAAAAAGASNRVDAALADNLVGRAGQFLALVDEQVRTGAPSGAAGAAILR
jgi:hypothetical protein